MEDAECASTTTITTITDESDEVTETGFESSPVTTSDTNANINSHVPATHVLSTAHTTSDEDVKMESDSNSYSNFSPSETNTKSSCRSSSAGLNHRVGRNSEHWYQNRCFNHYWHHYYFVSLWCQKHMEVYRGVHEQFSSQSNNSEVTTSINEADKGVFKKPVSVKTHRNRKARRRRKEAKKRMRLAFSHAETMNSSSNSLDEEDATDTATDDVDFAVKMDISEEMLDFFAHTHKHRAERDELKKKAKGTKQEKLINIEEVRSDQKERTVEAPKERPGSRRTEEMRFLYGKGAAMIHGMETALQMNFDRNLDVKQPKLWPNMPFKILFD
ncbi:gem-associated protein 8-like [Pomacea canaliculata]|nr:gem-associated protein 8-like [Pomacea canaliculata]